MVGWSDGGMDGRSDGRMVGWTVGQMVGRPSVQISGISVQNSGLIRNAAASRGLEGNAYRLQGRALDISIPLRFFCKRKRCDRGCRFPDDPDLIITLVSPAVLG